MKIHVARADIAAMPVEAVACPANSRGTMNSGVALALRARGGEAIEQEAVACAPIAVGAAVVTTGGQLAAKHVIHAPTAEEPGGKVTIENIRRATRAALIAAARNNFSTMALSGMGTGVGGLPPEEATRAMVDEIRAVRQSPPATLYLVDLDDTVVAAFEEALRNAQMGL
jgi:O-acetyl-ADP-ribose deacetylase (regulator of RNase III)